MSEPTRLKDAGTDAQKALLRAGAPEMPLGLKESVRARVESRISNRKAPWVLRMAFATGVLFVGGGAMAYGVIHVQRLWRAEQSAPAGAPTRVTRRYEAAPARQAIVLPPSDNEAEERNSQEPPKPQRRRTRPERSSPPLAYVEPPVELAAPPAPPAAPVLSGPGLGLHELIMEGQAEEPRVVQPTKPAPPAPRPGRFLVKWESRRGAALDVLDLYGQGDALARITGSVNRTPLSIDIRKRLIVGKIGDEVVNIWLKGEEQAEGSIAGYPVFFQVSSTQNGFLLRGTLPGHTARLETRKGLLRWYPGCENALAATSPGVYQGTCTEGNNASVVLPPAFRKLPPLARLVMLAIVLTERDPVFKDDKPQLFNPTP
ncbi:MAG: hypothetical protein SF187_04660 [Deltaproteobacteria bacterium]|nr:hypothetical protein [Deltaproteobacteria bacterium]